MQILIPTSDKTLSALQGFSYFWRQYANELKQHPIKVVGYTEPNFPLPDNYTFLSIGKFEDYPAQRWSDGLLLALETSNDPIVLLLFDDYWMLREIDVRAIRFFEKFMLENEDILRFDLSSDRLYASGVQEWGCIGCYDILVSNTTIPYHFSLQAALWRRELLRQIIIPNESAWECEMRGTERSQNHPEWKVLGTQQVPMKYLIAVQGGHLRIDGGYQVPRLDTLLKMNEGNFQSIRDKGFLANL